MMKQIWNLIIEPLCKARAPGQPLRWRMGMRLNHLNLAAMKWPRCYNAGIQLIRFVLCNRFGHRWGRWSHVKYGNFGESRTCKACRIHHSKNEKGVHAYFDTHRPGGWKKIA